MLRGETVTAAPLGPVDPPDDLAPGDRVVPLRAERLDVGTQRTTSEARVRKEVVVEQRTVTVPVRREQLVVERDGERDVRIPLGDDHRP